MRASPPGREVGGGGKRLLQGVPVREAWGDRHQFGTEHRAERSRIAGEPVHPGGLADGLQTGELGAGKRQGDAGGCLCRERGRGGGDCERLGGQNFTEVVWAADGSALVAGGFDSLVYVWRWPRPGAPQLRRYPGQVEAVTVTPDGVILAGGGGDHAIRRWTLSGLTELPPLHGHADDVYAVKVSPDGRLLASGGRDRTIRLWDATTGRALQVLRGHEDSISPSRPTAGI